MLLPAPLLLTSLVLFVVVRIGDVLKFPARLLGRLPIYRNLSTDERTKVHTSMLARSRVQRDSRSRKAPDSATEETSSGDIEHSSNAKDVFPSSNTENSQKILELEMRKSSREGLRRASALNETLLVPGYIEASELENVPSYGTYVVVVISMLIGVASLFCFGLWRIIEVEEVALYAAFFVAASIALLWQPVISYTMSTAGWFSVVGLVHAITAVVVLIWSLAVFLSDYLRSFVDLDVHLWKEAWREMSIYLARRASLLIHVDVDRLADSFLEFGENVVFLLVSISIASLSVSFLSPALRLARTMDLFGVSLGSSDERKEGKDPSHISDRWESTPDTRFVILAYIDFFSILFVLPLLWLPESWFLAASNFFGLTSFESFSSFLSSWKFMLSLCRLSLTLLWSLLHMYLSLRWIPGFWSNLGNLRVRNLVSNWKASDGTIVQRDDLCNRELLASISTAPMAAAQSLVPSISTGFLSGLLVLTPSFYDAASSTIASSEILSSQFSTATAHPLLFLVVDVLLRSSIYLFALFFLISILHVRATNRAELQLSKAKSSNIQISSSRKKKKKTTSLIRR